MARDPGALGRAGETADSPHRAAVSVDHRGHILVDPARQTAIQQAVTHHVMFAGEHNPNGTRPPRKPILLPSGKVKLRLTNKDPIQWWEVPEDMKRILKEAGIPDAATWNRDELCRLCAQKDHYGNRCYRVFKLTDKGRRWAAAMLKSQKVVQELGKDPPGMPEIQACILCIDETVNVAEGMLAIGADAVPDCTVADVCAAIVEGDLIDGDIVR